MPMHEPRRPPDAAPSSHRPPGRAAVSGAGCAAVLPLRGAAEAEGRLLDPGVRVWAPVAGSFAGVETAFRPHEAGPSEAAGLDATVDLRAWRNDVVAVLRADFADLRVELAAGRAEAAERMERVVCSAVRNLGAEISGENSLLVSAVARVQAEAELISEKERRAEGAAARAQSMVAGLRGEVQEVRRDVSTGIPALQAQVQELRAALDRMSDRFEVLALPSTQPRWEDIAATLQASAESLRSAVAGDLSEARSTMSAELSAWGHDVRADLGAWRQAVADDISVVHADSQTLLQTLGEVKSSVEDRASASMIEDLMFQGAEVREAVSHVGVGMQLCQEGIADLTTASAKLLERSAAAASEERVAQLQSVLERDVASLAELVGSGVGSVRERQLMTLDRVSALPQRFADPDVVEETRRVADLLLQRHDQLSQRVRDSAVEATVKLSSLESHALATTERFAQVESRLAEEIDGMASKVRDVAKLGSALDGVSSSQLGLRKEVEALRESIAQADLERQVAMVRDAAAQHHTSLAGGLRTLAGDVQVSLAKVLAMVSVETFRENLSPALKSISEVSESVQHVNRVTTGLAKTFQESADKQKVDIMELHNSISDVSRVRLVVDNHPLMQTASEIMRSLECHKFDITPLQSALHDMRCFSEQTAAKAEAFAREHATQLQSLSENRKLVDVSPAVAAVDRLRELVEARQVDLKSCIESLRRSADVDTRPLLETLRRDIEGLDTAEKRRWEVVGERFQEVLDRTERGRTDSLARIGELCGKPEKGREELLGKIRDVAERTDRARDDVLAKLQAFSDRADKDREEALEKTRGMAQRAEHGREESLAKILDLADIVARAREASLEKIQLLADRAERGREEASGQVHAVSEKVGGAREELLKQIASLAEHTDRARDEALGRIQAVLGRLEGCEQKVLGSVAEQEPCMRQRQAEACSQLSGELQEVRADIAGRVENLRYMYDNKTCSVAADIRRALLQMEALAVIIRAAALPQEAKQTVPRFHFVRGVQPDGQAIAEAMFVKP